MKKIFKKVMAIALIAFSLGQCFAFTACDDLGSYEDAEHKRGDNYVYDEKFEMGLYYDAYGTVTANYTDGNEILSYEIKDSLYNTTTKNEMNWGSGDVPVQSKAYVYIAIPVKKDLLVDDLALFFKADKFYSLRNPEILDDYREETRMDSWSSTVGLYLLSDASQVPTSYKRFGQPFTEKRPVTDNDGNPVTDVNGNPEMKDVKINYGDLDPATAIATVKISFYKNSWNSVFFSDWWDRSDPENPKQTNYIFVESGSVIVLRFEANQQNDIKTDFQFIDLMIRAL